MNKTPGDISCGQSGAKVYVGDVGVDISLDDA
jgi:hypothetical protein